MLNLAVAAGYWVTAELTLLPSTPAGTSRRCGRLLASPSPRSCSGASVCCPGIAVGALLTVLPRLPIWAVMIVAAGAVFEVLIDVTLLRRFGFDERLERVRDALLLGRRRARRCLCRRGFGATATLLSGAFSADALPYSLAIWWMRNWLGVQIVVALVADMGASRPIDWTWQRSIEGCGPVARVLLLALQLLFGVWSVLPGRMCLMAFLFFPLIG